LQTRAALATHRGNLAVYGQSPLAACGQIHHERQGAAASQSGYSKVPSAPPNKLRVTGHQGDDRENLRENPQVRALIGEEWETALGPASPVHRFDSGRRLQGKVQVRGPSADRTGAARELLFH
jgi:hypothetical protein